MAEDFIPDILTPADFIAARAALSRHARDGLLLDGVPLAAIAAAYGTPCHVFAADTLAARIATLKTAFPGVAIHYAIKANDHAAILAQMAQAGLGADVVSGGELQRAIAAGFAPEKIVFSGVGKTAAEIALALDHGAVQLNAESAEEVFDIAEIAAAREVKARVAIRVNPDIDAGTHDKISTGRAGDKFGVAYGDVAALYAQATKLPGLNVRGLAMHIGSQIFDSMAFARAYARLADLIRAITAAGHKVELADCGGGLGVSYAGQAPLLPEAWYGVIKNAFAGLDISLAIEPGRWLVAPCGVLLSRVIRVRRHGMPRPMLVLDAAMNDLIRPAMYGAYHGIIPVNPTDLVAPLVETDIVGPICESSDVFAKARMMPMLEKDALVAILDTGAYGAVMASTYNARPLAAQVVVQAGKIASGGRALPGQAGG
jgi:diaminopimelate decarboxylase